VYATPDEVRSFCGLSESECPDSVALEALSYAQGFIDDYCATTFSEPDNDSTYLYDGDGTTVIFAPPDGPFQSITKIEYYDGQEWQEYTGNYWIKAAGEYLELEQPATEGNQNWRITAKCWTRLNQHRANLLKRVTLMLCKLYLVPRDEPLGPSIRSISMEGISYSFQPINFANPTGNNEIDYILRILRRNVVHV